eukprot:CAMPEP_0114510408 /NCGR_PEP_ID=MMETSP0109-20121206/13771_1 /TAXON_ID=29199 /ORGANISM="Chlorarachnion reptans, Strain CCCM449" /LENGTH=423 /DNA_ID=CAMNT_0001689713 /DNA_START=81 /DNA_END=1352 /DNA_ORIENTATION=+
MKAKKRPQYPSLFSCCRPMDESAGGLGNSRFRERDFPPRYAFQFSLRQTLFGEIACAIDTKSNRRVAVKVSYKDRKFLPGGEDPRAEVRVFRTLESRIFRSESARSLASHLSYLSIASKTSVESKYSCELRKDSRDNEYEESRGNSTYTSVDMRNSNDTRSESGENLNDQSTSDSWHPNVIRFMHSQEDASKILTVLEFAQRGELLDLITGSQNGRLKENTAASIISQVAKGLQFCHANGVAHLDVSPENILLTRKWEAKLCDFGLAQLMDPSGIVSRSHSTGKANYMAPEAYATKSYQIRRSKSSDSMNSIQSPGKFAGAPADVFSLGIVMFLSVTGVLPYQYPQATDRRFVLVTGGKQNLTGLLKRWGIKISEDAIDLLARMLMEDPSERATMREVLSHPWIVRCVNIRNETEKENLREAG